ncbi:MAG: 1-acyl-sn-glycerol-3-phosphate acyltransferase [Thermosynechococcaceae cyanobacterium]
MPDAIRQAQPPLEFLPPAFNPWVFRVIRGLLPAWMHYKLKITEVEIRDLERLVDLYHQFQQGQARLFLAFRHPTTDDPFTMATLIWRLLPQAARRLGKPLSMPVHSHFIYDRGIPLWAGPLVSWLFPRLGGTPILRGRADRLGLKTARDLLANSAFPLAAAPEGATNDHSELMNSLEPGVAQLGFWCAEDLDKAGRTEATLIVPIGIRYVYLKAPWPQLETALTHIEQSCGLAQPGVTAGILADRQADVLYGRIFTVAEHLLDLTENFYRRFHGCTFAAVNELTPQGGERSEKFNTRLKSHLEVALHVAENRLEVKPQGTFVDRCRRLEQAGWDRIFREDIVQLSPVERGLADMIAEEASLALWHMRLAERLTVITGDYILQKPTAERFAEIVIILWRITAWLQGKSAQQPPPLGPRRVCISIGEPLSVTQRWPYYQENRRNARESVKQLTEDLQQALEKMLL